MRSIILFVMGLCLLCGCSGSNDEIWDDTEGLPRKYQVCIDLAIPEMGASGRASTDYDDGRSQPYENFIDINNDDYRFYAFDFDNRFIAALRVEEINPIETPATNSKKYQVLANFENDPGPDFKIVALANWIEYGGYYGDIREMTAGVTTIEDLLGDATAEFTINDITVRPGANNLIPMFGVKEFAGIEFVNFRVWLGDLHMLRAISKVEILIDPNADPMLHLNSLKLKNYYTLGVAMPALDSYLQSDYVNAGFATDYSQPATVRTGSHNPKITELDLTGKIVDDKVTFFLPEIRLIENYALKGVPFSYQDRTRLTASFTMEGNESFDSTYEYDIEFKFYDEAAAINAGASRYDFFDIKRNYFYRFAIKSVSGTDISLYADVVPYTELSLRPVFGFPQEESEDEAIPATGCGCTDNGNICTCDPGCGCCTH